MANEHQQEMDKLDEILNSAEVHSLLEAYENPYVNIARVGGRPH